MLLFRDLSTFLNTNTSHLKYYNKIIKQNICVSFFQSSHNSFNVTVRKGQCHSAISRIRSRIWWFQMTQQLFFFVVNFIIFRPIKTIFSTVYTLHAFNLDSFLIVELKIILQVRINISLHQQKRFNSKFMSSTNNLKLTTITDIVINLPGVMKHEVKYFLH